MTREPDFFAKRLSGRLRASGCFSMQVDDLRYDVFLIRRSSPWMPKHWSDVPPWRGGRRLFVGLTAETARITLRIYNTLELDRPKGIWTVMRVTQNVTREVVFRIDSRDVVMRKRRVRRASA